MSNNPSNTPKTGSGSPAEPLVSQDARAIFRNYYKSLLELPRGKLEADVVAIEAQHGPLTGYSKDQLIEIAREIRNALRKERQKQPEPTDPPVTSLPAKKWEIWLTRIGFGIFALAAVALFYYAISIKKLEPNWENLRPYIIGISATAILLLLLTFGRRQIERAGAPKWLGHFLSITMSVLFVAIVALVVIWFGFLILRDAGVIKSNGKLSVPPPNTFVYEACEGVTDRRLPDDTLGRADDDRLQPRQWMWSVEDNAEKQLGVDCVKLWLLTAEFAGAYHSFVAHVNVAVANEPIVSCHLLQPTGAVKRVELKREKPTPKEGLIHYFSVPESREGDQLLIFVAMRKATYQAIQHDPKFNVTKN